MNVNTLGTDVHNPIINRDGMRLKETCHNKQDHGWVRAIVHVKEANTRLCGDCLVTGLANLPKGSTYTIEVI